MGGWGFCFFYLCHKSVPGILTFGIKVGCTAMSWSAPNYYMSRGQECQAPVTNVAPPLKKCRAGFYFRGFNIRQRVTPSFVYMSLPPGKSPARLFPSEPPQFFQTKQDCGWGCTGVSPDFLSRLSVQNAAHPKLRPTV